MRNHDRAPGNRRNGGESVPIRVYTVAGLSMYPLYRDGDIVTGTDFSGRMKSGRCYGFTSKNGRLLHRFVGIRGGCLIFSGDDSAGFESVEPGAVFFEADVSGPPSYNLAVRVINELFFRIHIAGGQSTKIKSVAIRAVFRICIAGGGLWHRKKSM